VLPGQRGPEPVEARLPEASIPGDPGVDLPERRRAERVETPWPFGTDLHEARLLEDAKVPRDARLVDVDGVDDVVHRALTAQQRFDDEAARGVGQGLEGI
jgi:hypothetical protein